MAVLYLYLFLNFLCVRDVCVQRAEDNLVELLIVSFPLCFWGWIDQVWTVTQEASSSTDLSARFSVLFQWTISWKFYSRYLFLPFVLLDSCVYIKSHWERQWKGIGLGFLRTGVSLITAGKGTECLPAVAATPRSLLNAETGAPGCFGLFGWHVPSSGLL